MNSARSIILVSQTLQLLNTVASEFVNLQSMRHLFISVMTRLGKRQVHPALEPVAELAISLTHSMLSEFFDDASQSSATSQEPTDASSSS